MYIFHFQCFPIQFTDDYFANHMYDHEARKISIQHPFIMLRSSSRERRAGGRSFTGMGLESCWPSTSSKAQYGPSAFTTCRMSFVCMFTVCDATFGWFYMSNVKWYLFNWCLYILLIVRMVLLCCQLCNDGWTYAGYEICCVPVFKFKFLANLVIAQINHGRINVSSWSLYRTWFRTRKCVQWSPTIHAIVP